jgi:hypothetical protein
MRGIAFVPEVARFGPFTALPTATADISAEDAGLGDDIELLAPGLAALAMLAWIRAAFATGRHCCDDGTSSRDGGRHRAQCGASMAAPTVPDGLVKGPGSGGWGDL